MSRYRQNRPIRQCGYCRQSRCVRQCHDIDRSPHLTVHLSTVSTRSTDRRTWQCHLCWLCQRDRQSHDVDSHFCRQSDNALGSVASVDSVDRSAHLTVSLMSTGSQYRQSLLSTVLTRSTASQYQLCRCVRQCGLKPMASVDRIDAFESTVSRYRQIGAPDSVSYVDRVNAIDRVTMSTVTSVDSVNAFDSVTISTMSMR